jgi:oligoribonuclease
MVDHKEQNLVWIDLEMTGLCPEKDHILEIASLVTDAQLNIIAQGPSLIIHQSEQALLGMGDWVLKQHTRTGLLDAVRKSILTVAQAELQTVDFISQYCQPGISPLCGNSIWQDRAFLRLAMPTLHKFLHYRLIDVTSVKELVRRWYPHDPLVEFKKQDTHRALEDIKESVAELVYYREHFFVQSR